MTTWEDSLYVRLDPDQIDQLAGRYDIEFDGWTAGLPTSGHSGPREPFSLGLHPAESEGSSPGTDQIREWPIRLDVMADSERAVDAGLEEVSAYVESIGGRVRQ